MARTMRNYNLWLMGMAIILIGCVVVQIEAAAIRRSVVTSDGIPKNPVGYKRWVRRRPSPHDPNLSVWEVRHVYFVRRTTTQKPKAKPVIELTDDEMDRQIRCDFQPNLPECNTIHNGPSTSTPNSSSSSSSSTSTTTTSTTTTTTTPQPPATTTPPPMSTTSSTTTTTDLPFLPTLPEVTNTFTTSTTSTTSTSTPEFSTTTEDEYIPVDDDDYDDNDPNEDIDDEIDGEDEGALNGDDFFNGEGSIGGNHNSLE